jgi:hypothetical protein
VLARFRSAPRASIVFRCALAVVAWCTMVNGPCGWVVTPCDSCCTQALNDLGPLRPALEAMTTRILWSATGKRYGLCETTLRPCRRNCGSFWGGLPFPTRISGDWVNIPCGSCVGACGCNVLSEFIAENVESVVAVKVDGVDLGPAETVAVYDRRRLVRVDGDWWPTCQDLAATDDETGTWSVTVEQGEPVPEGGGFVGGILLCELAKACTSDPECRLPQRIQTITRQGVTVGFQDKFENLSDLRTGLFEVDLWIEAARTTKYAGASVSSIDVPRPAVLTWPLPETSV